MKTNFQHKKLTLNKITLAHLQLDKMIHLKAGATALTYETSCGARETECCTGEKTSKETQNGTCNVLKPHVIIIAD